METSDIENKPRNIDLLDREKQKGIEKHREIANHLHAAAANHFAAATHLKEGNYEKAAECAMVAKDYLTRASEAKREDMNADFKLHI
jgi:hypothetical protein